MKQSEKVIVFGIILLIIGLAAYFYNFVPDKWLGKIEYPYQGLGIILSIAGIAFIAFALFLHKKLD